MISLCFYFTLLPITELHDPSESVYLRMWYEGAELSKPYNDPRQMERKLAAHKVTSLNPATTINQQQNKHFKRNGHFVAWEIKYQVICWLITDPTRFWRVGTKCGLQTGSPPNRVVTRTSGTRRWWENWPTMILKWSLRTSSRREKTNITSTWVSDV